MLRIVALLFVGGPLLAQPTVIRAGRVFDPSTGRSAANQVIVVENGRITAIGAGVPVSKDAQVVDLSKFTVLPGLIDAHVHLAIGGPMRDNALAIVRAGFTTVVDLGARSTRVLRFRDSITAGHIPGPRVLAAGTWVGTKNGVCEFGGLGIEGGPDAFRARVRENVEAGADMIKVCVSGWPADAFANPDTYEISDEALAATVRAAHDAKRMTIAHAISRGGVAAALRAGVDGLAHAAYVDPSLLSVMLQRRVFMIPTLASLTSGDTSEAARALVKATYVAHRVGLPLVFGTDGGVLPHGQNAREFAALRDAGISPFEAIRMATLDAARSLGLQDSIGKIAPGMVADLIAVDRDPLDDATVFERVRFVMARGRVIRPVDVPPDRR